MKKRYIFLLLLVLVATGLFFFVKRINLYQTAGEMRLQGLDASVRVFRDERGVPYIHAKTLHDAIKAQGFITAQDRLFQMQLTRLFAAGRISELAGPDAKKLDIRMRTFGFYRMGKKHADLLDSPTKALLQAYCDGINAYIDNYAHEHPIEFKLAGIPPERFDVATVVSILYYMGWGASSNYSAEFLSQLMIEKVGIEKFKLMYPKQINPDAPQQFAPFPENHQAQLFENADPASLMAWVQENTQYRLRVGSNNWAVSPQKSASGKAILASDPHLDARMLPGTLYACGLFTPELRAVGVGLPGIPGLLIGRNQFIANGITNAYLDAQDLYIEKTDPNNANNYLEGDRSVPYETVEETLRMKDADAPNGFREEKHTIRLTRRGPIISDILPNMRSDKPIALRWGAYETMLPKLGLSYLLEAKSVQEAREILRHVTVSFNNLTLADVHGNIGWQTVGRIPIRKQGEGLLPKVVADTTDNWLGFVAFDSMPQQYSPEKGWIGNANHNTVPAGYPYYVSNQFSSRYRYERLVQLMNSQPKFSATDNWKFQRDCKNTLAVVLAPIMAEALKAQLSTQAMGEQLANWEANETLESVPATIYQYVYAALVEQMFYDELGEELGEAFAGEPYFWQENMEEAILKGDSPWFDKVNTPEKETLLQLIQMAGAEAKVTLESKFGSNMADWQWGKVHYIEYVNPIMREGFLKEAFGAKKMFVAGSGETLYRAKHNLSKPEEVIFGAALRMVVDFADEEKVMAVISGGEAARTLHPHHNSQIDAFTDGTIQYWWFSDAQIKAHAVSEVTLVP